ncbi:MAG: hypothetical protein ACFE9T_14380, partial [Promethearchaeota archaeon]
MNIKNVKKLSILIILILGLAIFATPALAYGQKGHWGKKCEPHLASEDEMFGWIEDLWEIGDRGRYGYRMPGTAAELEGAEYILDKFEDFGLENPFLEPFSISVCFPDVWSLTLYVDGETISLPCGFVRYAAFTPPEGIMADLVYVGMGSAS